jgi:hypothetical protein
VCEPHGAYDALRVTTAADAKSVQKQAGIIFEVAHVCVRVAKTGTGDGGGHEEDPDHVQDVLS